MNCPTRRRFLHTLSASSLLTLLPPARAHADHDAPRMGLHGMVLFGGREGLYASHLPMFHRPHDLQLVLRVALQDAALDARMRGALAGTALWTLSPERFDLGRLQPGAADPLRQFRATLHEGHFERGGPARHAGVVLQVERVELLQRLDPTPRRAGQQRFLWLGQGREHFLLKHLDQRPDIDLIGRFETREPRQGGATLTLPGGGVGRPDEARLNDALQQAGVAPLSPVRWLYEETGDLA